MGRIFVGLCQVGAWGCFDEFNRLEERILSAVSQQIQSIQLGLSANLTNSEHEIELVGRQLKLSQDTGIFITSESLPLSLSFSTLTQTLDSPRIVNPGYAGRSNLPDNLKKLFRSIAMTRPDRELIAQVMLFSQGFRTAETLASKIVPFFNLCAEQLSSQPHYDFGLRALKAVLTSAGHLKRERLQSSDQTMEIEVAEQEIVIQSVTETIVPKLVADDVPLLTRRVQLSPYRLERNQTDFPESSIASSPMSSLESITFLSTSISSKSISQPFVQSDISLRTKLGFERWFNCTRFKTFNTV